MNQKITLTWKGHSCFKVETDGYTVVFDPYQDGKVPGYGLLRETADEVICSHDHGDHNAAECITLSHTHRNSPFSVTQIQCPHDDADGTLRGMNTITVLDSGSIRLAHFGDIGCPLTAEQIAALGHLDVCMIPVGGYFTMEPEGIQALLEILKPTVVIPMHYRTPDFGYPVIGTLDAFTRYRSDVKVYASDSITVDKDTPAQTAVLTYGG